MEPKPYPLPISYGQTDAVKNSGGHLINMEAEKAPDDARTPVTLVGCPGLKLYANTGVNPVLQTIEVDGAAYLITKAALYRLFPDTGIFKLGAVDLDPLCSVSTNGLAIVVTDGKKAFAYTIRSDEQSRYDNNTAFVDFIVELTGVSNFHPASTVTFLDTYLIFGRDGTTQFFNSGILGLTFQSTAFSSAETNPDHVVAVKENQQQLWIIGAKTYEIFSDIGVGDSPFERIPGAVGDHGSGSPYTVQKLRGSLLWLDQDGVVVKTSGYQPVPISTHAIEAEIKKRDKSTAFAFPYSEGGHDYYQLTVGDFTAAYDLSTGLWHRRQDHTHGRHRANCHVLAYGKNLVGSFVDGKIYEMSKEFYSNDGDPLVAQIITGPIETGQQPTSFPTVELDPDIGVGNSDCPDPVIGLELSNDDGKTWGNQRTKPIGKVGRGNTRVRWKKNGQARQRRHRFVLSDPVKRSLPSQVWIEIK